MKERLLNASIFAGIAAVIGAAVAFWQQLDAKLGIIIAVTAIGFVLGLLFRLR